MVLCDWLLTTYTVVVLWCGAVHLVVDYSYCGCTVVLCDWLLTTHTVVVLWCGVMCLVVDYSHCGVVVWCDWC